MRNKSKRSKKISNVERDTDTGKKNTGPPGEPGDYIEAQMARNRKEIYDAFTPEVIDGLLKVLSEQAEKGNRAAAKLLEELKQRLEALCSTERDNSPHAKMLERLKQRLEAQKRTP